MNEEQINAGVRQLLAVVRANLGIPDMLPPLWWLLADAGRPVSVKQLAETSGLRVQDLRAELARQPGVDWDGDRIAGFGLTLHPTPHAFTFDAQTVYGFCATDTLQFPPVSTATAS